MLDVSLDPEDWSLDSDDWSLGPCWSVVVVVLVRDGNSPDPVEESSKSFLPGPA